MKIKRYNPQKLSVDANAFFIQSHGYNAGKPLKKPIPNSWQIETPIKNAFEICYVVFHSKILEKYIRGSVVPFISLHEYKKVIAPYLRESNTNESILKKLNAVELIDSALQELEKKKSLYLQMKTALSYELIKNLNAQ